jgi:hypothetical protein
VADVTTTPTALLALVNELEAPTEPGILGVYRRLCGPEGTVAERPPEPPRDRCTTGVRVENGMERCSLSLGHRGDHTAPVPA